MSPRRAIVFTILVAILLPYYYFVDRPQLKIAAIESEQSTLLDIKGAVDSITVTRGDEKIRYVMMSDGQHYRVVEPDGKFIPQDLMQAMTGLLTDAKSVEVVSTNPGDMAEFGLDKPRGEIILQAASKPQPINIFFGNLNPTQTAVYARIDGNPQIFLLGKNLDYYETLMFEWVEGKQGKNA